MRYKYYLVGFFDIEPIILYSCSDFFEIKAIEDKFNKKYSDRFFRIGYMNGLGKMYIIDCGNVDKISWIL